VSKQQILHVTGIEKFISSFIDLLEKRDDFADHLFYIHGDEQKYPISRRKNTTFSKDYSGCFSAQFDLVKKMNSSKKIILHSLFDPKITALLFLQPWLLKKCYWMIWGADLYNYQLAERNWKWHIKEFFRRPVIKRMGHLVTYIAGDVDLARKWYGAIGKHHKCIMYTSNIYREYLVPVDSHDGINIQIGNSADPTNNHLEIFEKLFPFRNQNIFIYAPLSYGNQEYARSIIKAGVDQFGEKFIPMTDFMPFDDYLKFLGKIDIAIFNHKRQQAMGNTITLLGLGKKVYLRDDVTPWKMFEKIDAKVYSTSSINLTPISENIKSHNQSIIKEHFSEKTLLDQLENIFKE